MTCKISILFTAILLLIFSACNAPENPDALVPEHGELTGFPAIDAITKDIRDNPKDPNLYVARCEAYSLEGMYKEAVKDAEKILSMDSTNWKSYRILAGCYLDNDESKRSIKTLEKALEIQPKNTHLLLVHAEISHILKQYDQGLISAENVLKQEPQNIEGLFMKGILLKDMGDTINAINNFQTAVEQDADHFDSYIELGNLFYKRGNPIALQYYKNALRVDSTNYLALKGVAHFYHQSGALEEAKVAYERMIYHHPQEADGSYNYGLLYMELEDYEKAHNFFNVAVQYDPQFGEAYYYKAMASEKMGKIADAITDYKNAESNSSKNRRARASAALARLQRK
jgi:tetratricopeptide (TPR) repeat protein